MAKVIQAYSTLALGVAALALAAPAGARTIDGWEVVSDGQHCTMTSTFADNVSVGLIWAPKTGELAFMTAVPHLKELRGQAVAPVELTFDGTGPYTQWEDQRATVVSGLDNDALIANWGPAHADELAKAVGASGHVAVRVGGKEIGTYDLSGSPAAYRALTRCGSQLAAK